QYLSDNDYATLSAGEYFQVLMGTRPAPPGAVVLTFDDGRGSLWSVGQPLLRRFGMKGIVFLVPGRTVSRPGTLPPTWDDVRARRKGLVERRPIAGRWETPAQQQAALHRELSEARRLIEERTGQPVVHLCYPWHVAGPTARRLAREDGYRTAFCGKVRGTPLTL